jgi:hypothetical protein
MMSQRSKRELIEAIRPRCLKGNKAGKQQILDEFIATTGYHRKYAIRVLKHGPNPKGLKKPGRRKVNQGAAMPKLIPSTYISKAFCRFTSSYTHGLGSGVYLIWQYIQR